MEVRLYSVLVQHCHVTVLGTKHTVRPGLNVELHMCRIYANEQNLLFLLMQYQFFFFAH